MFCPECRSEYRPGFTRCGTCEVDLVAELSPEGRPGPAGSPGGSGPLVDFCGFLSLDEARESRDTLKAQGVRSEIAIRDHDADRRDAPVREEYWLKVPAGSYDAAKAIVGYVSADETAADDESLCSECGETLDASETFCPHCGAKFD